MFACKRLVGADAWLPIRPTLICPDILSRKHYLGIRKQSIKQFRASTKSCATQKIMRILSQVFISVGVRMRDFITWSVSLCCRKLQTPWQSFTKNPLSLLGIQSVVWGSPQILKSKPYANVTLKIAKRFYFVSVISTCCEIVNRECRC